MGRSLSGRTRRNSAEGDDIGQDPFTRLEFPGTIAVEAAVADGDRVAVELVDPEDRGELLLIGPGELDPIQASGRCRLIDLDFTLGAQVEALAGRDRRVDSPALDLQHHPDVMTRAGLGHPPA